MRIVEKKVLVIGKNMVLSPLPSVDINKFQKVLDPCIIVIFGATGDLTARKLIPALYNLAREGQLPAHFACVGFARRPKSHALFREEMRDAVSLYSRSSPIDEALWNRFEAQLFYLESPFDHDEGYEALRIFLDKLDQELGTKGNRIHYLSVQPSFFPTIVKKLQEHHLIYDQNLVKEKWSRVIIEKPFGEDTESAIELQKSLIQHLSENQIYRIDHYLGKETVQNILVFRFGNSIFESLWNNRHIDNIQITVAEEIGIGTRGRFWEEAGMLRDMVQNHVMQLLTLIAMEPPSNMRPASIHNEKVKVVEAIRPFPLNKIDEFVVRGQYEKGIVNREAVLGYRSEANVNPESTIETYVALQLYIDNWRWDGVPFFIRAGKRLPKRATEIAITFKKTPRYFFSKNDAPLDSNVLVFRIQPDEGSSLMINCKIPGLNQAVQPVKMDFHYGSYFGATPPEAYERLICDAIAGDKTLFARDDEVIKSWEILTPILDYWKNHPPKDFPNYVAGSWGPEEAEKLIRRQGREWNLV